MTAESGDARPVLELFSLRGRVAVVTGAGSGLGRVFSEALAEAGATVVAADIRMDDAQETAQRIASAGGTAEAARVDVADVASVDALAATLAQEYGAVHVLVNNAGVTSRSCRVHEMPVEEWDRVVGINLRGTFLCSRAILPLLMRAPGASVINITSILGLRGLDPRILDTIPYSASKAGVIGLTLQMAVDYAADGVRVNAIAPGWHPGTNLGLRAGNHLSPERHQAFRRGTAERTPLGRNGDPLELRGLLLYLASDASSFVTGQVIAHDGGWTAW